MTQTVVTTGQPWRLLKIGGGGYCTRLDVNDNGEVLMGTDTWGAYKRSFGDAQWEQICTSDRFSGTLSTMYYPVSGGYETVFAPTDPNKILFIGAYQIFLSTNSGATWTDLTLGTTNPGIREKYDSFGGYQGCSVSGSTVTLNSSPDLSAVPTDGSVSIYIANCTNTGLKRFPIVGKNVGAYTVTVSGTPSGTITNSPFVIGNGVSGGQMWANSPTRMAGPFACFDPVNANVIYVSNHEYVWISLDSGATWTQAAGTEKATSSTQGGCSGLVIDKSSATVSPGGISRKSTIMFHSYGNGWYRSTDGGVTWSLNAATGPGYPASGSKTIWDAKCNDAGFIVATDQDDLWKYTGGAWTKITSFVSGTSQVQGFDFDPASQNRIVSFDAGGWLRECLDITATTPTFTGPFNGAPNKIGMDVPWMAHLGEETFMSAGRGRFSRTEANRFIFPMGIGVFYSDLTPGFTSVTWTNWTTGIENLVVKGVKKYKGYPYIGIPVYDRGCFISSNPEAFAYKSLQCLNANVNSTSSTVLRWGSEFSMPDDGSNVMAVLGVFGNEHYKGGVSRDGGVTWEYLNYPFVSYTGHIHAFDVIETTSGSSTVTVNWVGNDGVTPWPHDLTNNQWIAFQYADPVGNIDLSGKRYQITVTSTTQFTLNYGTNASVTQARGGGNICIAIKSQNNGFSTTTGDKTVRFTYSNDDAGEKRLGDKWYFFGTTAMGNVNMEGGPHIATAKEALTSTTGWVEFEVGTAADTTTANGGGSNLVYSVGWPDGGTAYESRLVMSTATNWILVTSLRGHGLSYTTDAGATWARCAFPTSNTFPTTMSAGQWVFQPFQSRNTVDSDPNNPGHFYAMPYSGGFFKSVDGGATFTKVSNASWLYAGNWHANLQCVPGFPGHMFYSLGNMGNTYDPGYMNAWFTTDYGVTWSAVGNPAIQDGVTYTDIWGVNFLSVGAIKPGCTYPTLWMFAKIDGVWGNYYCTDADPTTTGKWTWNLTENYAMGWSDYCTGYQADPDDWSTCYAGFIGSGAKYTTLQDVTKRTFQVTT
jgi:hypothetical protein